MTFYVLPDNKRVGHEMFTMSTTLDFGEGTSIAYSN